MSPIFPLSIILENHLKKRTGLYLNGIFAISAIVIILDFLWPGEIISDQIIEVKKERQQYYNAARNYHYSYKVITGKHSFLVAEDFAKSDLTNKQIQYSVSLIFKEVNWYKLVSSEKKRFYSLRVASGFILPMLAIIAIFIVQQYKRRIGPVVLILKILLIGDLILLIA